MQIKVSSIILQAYRDTGLIADGAEPSEQEYQNGKDTLNRILRFLSAKSLLTPIITRENFYLHFQMTFSQNLIQ